MNTNIVIKTAKGLKAGAELTVLIKKNDTITFLADGGDARLGFPGHTAKILDPKPNHAVTLKNGEKVIFTFTSDAPGNYCVLTLTHELPIPDTIDCDQSGSAAAQLIIKGRTDRPTPQPDPDTQPVIDPND